MKASFFILIIICVPFFINSELPDGCLEELDKPSDKLSVICGNTLSFKNIPQNLNPDLQLEVLVFYGSKIEGILKNAFKVYSKHRYLFIKNCKIDRIEKSAFKSIDSLEEIGLDESEIKSLAVDTLLDILTLPKLYKVTLNLPGVLTDDHFKSNITVTSPIVYLDLGLNGLSQFPKLNNLIYTAVFTIQRNRITELNTNDIASMCSLSTLIFENNPLNFTSKKCECLDLQRWIKKRKIEFYSEEECPPTDACPKMTRFPETAMSLRKTCLQKVHLYDGIIEQIWTSLLKI